MVDHAHGRTDAAFASLDAARSNPHSAVVFEADDGGTVYLTIPVAKVRCDEAALARLLDDIDARFWNEPSARRLFFEPLPIGSSVTGGMGGGRVVDGLWLHPEIEALGIRARIEAVLAGERERLA